MHFPKKNFKCDLCRKEFILASSLDKHKLECDKYLKVKDKVVVKENCLFIKSEDSTNIKVEDIKEEILNKEDSLLDRYEIIDIVHHKLKFKILRIIGSWKEIGRK